MHPSPESSFPEDALPLLAPSIHVQDAGSFFLHVQGLYEPRTSSGKVSRNLPKGKFLTKPTKGPKRPTGTYEIRYQTALGLKTEVFEFPRDLTLSPVLIDHLSKLLTCPEKDLQEFLLKKKFLLARPDAS